MQNNIDLCSESITKMLNSVQPCWINRFGGSDIPLVNFIIKCNYSKIDENLTKILKKYNGYFNTEDNDNIVLNKITQMYIKSYLNSDYILFLKGSETHNEIMEILTSNNKLVNKFSYHCFLESFTPFMESFKNWGDNKKILVISPFEKTILYQTTDNRINKILKNYTFPNCKFLTYKTPILYNGSDFSTEYFNSILEDTNCKNSLELCSYMMNDISKIDFDIAFLSCGMYAVLLGDLIKTELNKKAIYVGGMLNVIFNFYGKRYDTTFFDQFINKEYQINVLDDFNDLTSKSNLFFKNEALNAYI
jgi:hypothetical protein